MAKQSKKSVKPLGKAKMKKSNGGSDATTRIPTDAAASTSGQPLLKFTFGTVFTTK
jgi:hypothetical protein